jgi:hypothetical protein
LSDSDDNDANDVNDPHRALNIDLDMPLREDERLPVVEHRIPNTQTIHKMPDKTVHISKKVSEKNLFFMK